jgi:hypothetical protein
VNDADGAGVLLSLGTSVFSTHVVLVIPSSNEVCLRSSTPLFSVNDLKAHHTKVGVASPNTSEANVHLILCGMEHLVVWTT